MDASNTLMREIIDLALSAESLTETLSERRLKLGETLCELFGASVFVSYVCDSDGPYSNPVQFNLGDDGLTAYDEHFRHVDTLTPQLFGKHRATGVTPVQQQSDEFVYDFLRPRGMFHGVNYFPANTVTGSVDLRLWRGRGARPFSTSEVRTLQSIGDLIAKLWREEQACAALTLTPRESQIAGLVADGWGDKQICTHLGISLATLRTHLSHSFEKTGARNRAGLASYYLRHREV